MALPQFSCGCQIGPILVQIFREDRVILISMILTYIFFVWTIQI
jgi:hypothetical protein